MDSFLGQFQARLAGGSKAAKCGKPKKAATATASKKKAATAEKTKYNGKEYTVRVGERGGKYIVCKGKRVYL
jgi:hypothetical protein